MKILWRTLWFVSRDETVPHTHPQGLQEGKGACFYSYPLFLPAWVLASKSFSWSFAGDRGLPSASVPGPALTYLERKYPFHLWEAQHQGWTVRCPCIPGGNQLSFVTAQPPPPVFRTIASSSGNKTHPAQLPVPTCHGMAQREIKHSACFLLFSLPPSRKFCQAYGCKKTWQIYEGC